MFSKKITGEKNIWKYIFLNGIAFIFLIVLIDFVAGHLLQHYYFKIKSGPQYRTTFAIEKTTSDIIIFGSSRAMDHYNPFVFEDRFKLSYYNAGRDGENTIFYHYAVLKGILKRYAPKIAILDLTPGEFGETTEGRDRLASLAPYYNRHPEMRSIIELRSNTEKIKMLSGIYPFNSNLMNIISGNMELDKKNYIKGYYTIASSYKITKPIVTVDKSRPYKLDSSKINILDSFIKDCARANTKLYIVCSPVYAKFIGTDYSLLAIKNIASAENINFYNFSQDSLFLESPKLFFNDQHMNDSGARIFSNKLIDKIDLSEMHSTNQQ